MSYQLLKTLHLLGVVLFLGNIIVTAVWKTAADRSRNTRIIAFAQRLVTMADLIFTALGAGLILITGLWLAGSHTELVKVAWLRWGFLLFAASGAVWVIVLIPLQVRQMRLVRGLGPGGEIPQAYWQLARYWAVFGTIATLLPLVNLYLMVFKPG